MYAFINIFGPEWAKLTILWLVQITMSTFVPYIIFHCIPFPYTAVDV